MRIVTTACKSLNCGSTPTQRESVKIPNVCRPWSEEETFAYRMREVLQMAFYAGARYAHANPAVMERGMPRAVPASELGDQFDFVEAEFHDWVGRKARDADYFKALFGFSEDTVTCYFPIEQEPA